METEQVHRWVASDKREKSGSPKFGRPVADSSTYITHRSRIIGRSPWLYGPKETVGASGV